MSDNTDKLLEIMAKLRNPDGGCPWDVEQDFASIAPYTIEEAYEVADAISKGDMEGLKNELGDLLFQVVFHAQMAHEAGHFGYEDVAKAVSDKMVRRHPHVFGDAGVRTAEAQTQAWEDIKAKERQKDADLSALAKVGCLRSMVSSWVRGVGPQKFFRMGDWPVSKPEREGDVPRRKREHSVAPRARRKSSPSSASRRARVCCARCCPLRPRG